MALVVRGSGPDMPVPLAITSPIPSRSSWWRFSAGWTTVSALKCSQPPWVSWKFGSFLLIFNNPCHTVSSRSRHMKWLMPLKGSIAESFLSTWGATRPPCVLGCDKLFFRWRDGYTKLHITVAIRYIITYLFFRVYAMVCRVESCWVAGPLIKVRQKPTAATSNDLKLASKPPNQRSILRMRREVVSGLF